MTCVTLTPSQARYLKEIREAGERTYNGRARKPLAKLRALGLIEYDFELVEHGTLSFRGIRYTERFTARPLPQEAESDET